LLAGNAELLGSELARDVFQIAVALLPAWPSAQAHDFMLQVLGEEGIDRVVDLVNGQDEILDHARHSIDGGDFEEALQASALGILIRPSSAAFRFYASVAAAFLGATDAAESIMRESADRAEYVQALQGIASLDGYRQRLDLDADLTERLKLILSAVEGVAAALSLSAAHEPKEDGD